MTGSKSNGARLLSKMVGLSTLKEGGGRAGTGAFAPISAGKLSDQAFTVECDQLSVGWADEVLLKHLSLEVPFRSFNCVLPVIGRTGRGKSTLLYALSGMAQPKEGRICWHFPGDLEPTAWSTEPGSFKVTQGLRRHRFGFLLQDASMIRCFTIAENIRHMLRLRGFKDRVEERVSKAIACMLIEPETVDELSRKYPLKLSGGQRQRMALAAAIAHDPVVLFADEPTASLDDQSGLEVLNVIRRWLDEAKGERAFVFVTHRVETLQKGIGAMRALELRREAGASEVTAVWSGTTDDFAPDAEVEIASKPAERRWDQPGDAGCEP
jgi:ABC-type lipoprotein export system ATPase subunit